MTGSTIRWQAEKPTERWVREECIGSQGRHRVAYRGHDAARETGGSDLVRRCLSLFAAMRPWLVTCRRALQEGVAHHLLPWRMIRQGCGVKSFDGG